MPTDYTKTCEIRGSYSSDGEGVTAWCWASGLWCLEGL